MLLTSSISELFCLTNTIRIINIMELVGSFKIVAIWSAASRRTRFLSSERNCFANANFDVEVGVCGPRSGAPQ